MNLFVGIDVSSKDMKACLMNQAGETLQAFTIDNNLQGASYLRDQMVSCYDQGSFQTIQIGLEATSVYSWHPAMFFHEDQMLRDRNAKVYTMNPKLIRKFKDAYPDLDKNDHVDAWLIADRIRFGRLPLTIVMQEQYVALQRLTRMRYHLVHNLTREKQVFFTTFVF